MLDRQRLASLIVNVGHITRAGRIARAPIFFALERWLKVRSVETRFAGRTVRLHLDNTNERKFLVYPYRYYRMEFEFIRSRFPSTGGVFVDVGSNAGLFSFQACCVARSGCRVVAIEPNPEMVERSRACLLREGAFDSRAVTISLHPVAVGSAEGVSCLDTSLGFGGAFLSAQATQGPQVRVERLAEVLRHAGVDRVDMLKIDVEGHEPEALSSLLEAQNWHLLPTGMILEHCHRERWSSDLLARLTALGYRAISRNWNNVLLWR